MTSTSETFRVAASGARGVRRNGPFPVGRAFERVAEQRLVPLPSFACALDAGAVWSEHRPWPNPCSRMRLLTSDFALRGAQNGRPSGRERVMARVAFVMEQTLGHVAAAHNLLTMLAGPGPTSDRSGCRSRSESKGWARLLPYLPGQLVGSGQAGAPDGALDGVLAPCAGRWTPWCSTPSAPPSSPSIGCGIFGPDLARRDALFDRVSTLGRLLVPHHSEGLEPQPCLR